MSTHRTKSPTVSIIIPAYNEAERITPTLRALHAFLAPSGLAWDLLVVDDGSRDATVQVVEALALEIPGLAVLRQPRNMGKGAAVRAGMLAARGKVRVMCDADGSMPASELPKLLAPLLAGEVDVAIGSRYVAGARSDKKQPRYRVLWSRLCNRVIQAALVPGVRDTQCGFKAFSARAAEDLFGRATVNGWAFDLEILALARRLGYAIDEVGVSWTDDARSKVNPVRDAFKVIGEALTIRRNLRRKAYGELVRVPA
jgi:dolichyl-phosphate beta-glucosyltransferase